MRFLKRRPTAFPIASLLITGSLSLCAPALTSAQDRNAPAGQVGPREGPKLTKPPALLKFVGGSAGKPKADDPIAMFASLPDESVRPLVDAMIAQKIGEAVKHRYLGE